MKKVVASLSLFVALATGCPCDAQKVDSAVNGALTFAQFACVQFSASTDASEVAIACKVVDAVAKLTPEILRFVEQMIASREAAKMAGYVYDSKAGWKRP